MNAAGVGVDGTGGATGKYRVSPLAVYDRAVETASALLALQVSPASITFELRREHGFNEAQANAVIRDARCVTTA
jgi:hypothetical protein